ncbi:hypothetical protein HY844_01705 [Candidatus Berkelbacteria bacterium]|nr:hypothetical protein [Candidatus Berkelbacteria bacterium]
MLYAQIIIAKRSSTQELTYFVPERIIPYIKVGSLVSVPVRNKILSGVVTAFKKNVPAQIKSKLKAIEKIDKEKVISSLTIKLFEQLSKKYQCSLAQVAHMALKGDVYGENISGEQFEQIFIQGPLEFRLQKYQEILKNLNSGLVLFATHEIAEHFKKLIRNKNITVGTIGESFKPLQSSAVIIVDQSGSYNERRPYISSLQIALMRAELEKRRIYIGESILSVNFIAKLSVTKGKILSNIQESDYLVVDNQRHSQINESIIEILKSSKENNHKVLVIAPSESFGGAIYCLNCKKLQHCQKCKRPLGAVNDGVAICGYCSHQTTLIQCMYCKNTKLIELGFNTKLAQSQIKKLLGPNKFTFVTEAIFSSVIPKSDVVVLLGFDRYLTSSKYNQTMRLFGYLVELQAISPKIIIQTKLPDHPYWGNVSALKLKNIFKNELLARRRYKLPPYGGYFELIGLGKVEKEAEQIIKIAEDFGCSVSSPKKLKGSKTVLEIFHSNPIDFDKFLKNISPAWQIKF